MNITALWNVRPYFNRFIKHVDIAVTLCTRILEVPGSNLRHDTGYPDRFIAVCRSPFRKMRGSTWSKPRLLLFEPFLLITHSTIRHYNAGTDNFVKYPARSFTFLFLCMEIMRMARVTQEAALTDRARQ